MSSFVLLPEEVPKGFLEGYTPVAALLVLFQAFHGLAVTLVYKYALGMKLSNPNPNPNPNPYSNPNPNPYPNPDPNPNPNPNPNPTRYADAIVKNFANATVSTHILST